MVKQNAFRILVQISHGKSSLLRDFGVDEKKKIKWILQDPPVSSSEHSEDL
jgi:hypothetical protein